MIFDQLDRRVKAMNHLCQLKRAKDNRALQAKVDAQYHELVKKMDNLRKELLFVHDTFHVDISDAVRADLLKIVGALKSSIRSGYADQDVVSQANQSYKAVYNGIKKEWTSTFAGLTCSAVNTLRVIQGINSEEVGACLLDIQAAATWPDDLLVLQTLKDALSRAEALIHSLDMDQNTITFLTKMTTGKATMEDLNDQVLDWICRENLKGKIKLTFMMK